MNYRDEVLKNVHNKVNKDQYLTMGALGLAGEAGECADLIKKYLFQGAPFNREKLIKELGDVRWYLEILCYCADTTISEVERINVEKLKQRYPQGFSTEASNNRKSDV